VSISYLEIYNEMGYDLLNPDREVKGLEDLPQVTIQEDEEEVIHYRNLSTHRAGSEEEALNLVRGRERRRGWQRASGVCWQGCVCVWWSPRARGGMMRTPHCRAIQPPPTSEDIFKLLNR
jgi:hypothetical protein